MNIIPTTNLPETFVQTEMPLVSLMESQNYYMLALDLPTMPAQQLEIKQSPHQLKVEGVVVHDDLFEKITLFKSRSKTASTKAVYKDGVLWILLPKKATEIAQGA